MKRGWQLPLALLLLIAAATAAVGNELTAYDQLEAYGFPRGLLPETVVSYTLEENGKFVVNLAGSCSFTIPGESIPVKYSDKITGVLHYGVLKDLGGVQVKVLFLWFGINGIEVQGDDLKFSVGIISKSYPVSNFDEGLACDVKSYYSRSNLRAAFM